MNTKKVLSDTNNRKSTFYRFVTIRKSIVYKLRNKRRPFALQKGVFYVVKGHLLQCKRAPFKMQKDTF